MLMFNRLGYLFLLIFSLVVVAAQAQQPQRQPKPTPAPFPAIRQDRPGQPPQDIIESIVVRGSSRIPQDTLNALMDAKAGGKYSAATLQRDYVALWNTGRFNDLRLEREPGKTGWIITYVMVDRPAGADGKSTDK
jgi:outer membrane protein insertion porin family